MNIVMILILIICAFVIFEIMTRVKNDKIRKAIIACIIVALLVFLIFRIKPRNNNYYYYPEQQQRVNTQIPAEQSAGAVLQPQQQASPMIDISVSASNDAGAKSGASSDASAGANSAANLSNSLNLADIDAVALQQQCQPNVVVAESPYLGPGADISASAIQPYAVTAPSSSECSGPVSAGPVAQRDITSPTAPATERYNNYNYYNCYSYPGQYYNRDYPDWDWPDWEWDWPDWEWDWPDWEWPEYEPYYPDHGYINHDPEYGLGTGYVPDHYGNAPTGGYGNGGSRMSYSSAVGETNHVFADSGTENNTVVYDGVWSNKIDENNGANNGFIGGFDR